LLSRTSAPGVEAAAPELTIRAAVNAATPVHTILPPRRPRCQPVSIERNSLWYNATPEPSPECTPSLSSETSSVPPISPRSEVVDHSWS